MQNKQPEAFGYAYCLESRGFEAEATLLRTQHAELQQWKNVFGHLGTADECGNEWIRLQDSIKHKDALLRQALALCQWIGETQHPHGSVNGLAAQIKYAIEQELSQ